MKLLASETVNAIEGNVNVELLNPIFSQIQNEYNELLQKVHAQFKQEFPNKRLSSYIFDKALSNRMKEIKHQFGVKMDGFEIETPFHKVTVEKISTDINPSNQHYTTPKLKFSYFSK